VATLAVRCPPEEIANPNAVKVVTALDGRALYFSRATIPFDRDGAGPATASTWGSMPIARPRWSALPRCRLRRWSWPERLEQLRLLENGIALYVAEAPATPSAWIPRRICCGPRRC
jgi:3-deoxy-manno-octulosonate cytidylyltransferase (CMP-KDO synthetase)